MRTKEEYLDIIQKLNKIGATYDLEKVQENFNIEAMYDVLDINKNIESFNYAHWNTLFNRNKDNDFVLLHMIRTGKCPIEIIEKIINNTETVRKNIFRDYERNHSDNDIFLETLQYELPKHLFDTIYKYYGSNMVNLFDTQYSYSNKAEKVSETVRKLICDKVKENYEPPKEKSSYFLSNNTDHKTDCFRYIRDHQYIKQLMNEDIHENIRTALLNNFNLHPENPLEAEIMNRLYDDGCVLQYIRNWTDYIKREATSSLYEAYLTGFDEVTGKVKEKPGRIYYDAKYLLEYLAEKEVLDGDYEYDLAMRLIDLKERASDGLIAAVFCHTKNPCIMTQIKNLKSGDKVSAYERNEYLTYPVIKERVDEIMKKIKKLYDKDKARGIPDVWYDYLSDYANKIPFDSEQYQLVAGKCEKQLAISISTSKKTPVKDLIKFADVYKKIDYEQSWFSYISNIVTIATRANIFCRENSISDKTSSELLRYIRELPPSTNIKDFDGKHYCNNLSYATQSLRHIIEYGDRDEAKKVYFFFKDMLKESDITDKEKGNLEYSIAVMEKEFAKKEEVEKFENEKDFSKFSDEYLETRRKRLYYFAGYYADDAIIYTKINDLADEINNIYNECEKRGLFKEKEEKETEK